MTSNTQSNKSLHNKINQTLNMVITKIIMTYKIEAEQNVLITEMKQKSVRAFIMCLKSPILRNSLYGNTPKTLSEAFAIAQTVYYDNQYLQLENLQSYRTPQQGSPMSITRQNPNFNQNIKPKIFEKSGPEPMEVEKSNKFRQPTDWQQPADRQISRGGYGQKREFEPGRTQQTQKMQRINKLLDSEEKLSHLDEVKEEMGEIPEDLISVSSEASAFLGE